jgi:type VI secretion system protein ImpG
VTDELLTHYNRELSALRNLGAEFAQAYPKIAGRLRLGPDGSEDPHVERLVQACAYLNARTRHKLDDDFPEISDALLGVLYPHYQLPIPSMAIAQLHLDPEQLELTTGVDVEGHTALETEPIDGEPCRFRTAYPVTLWPIEVRQARMSRPPFDAPNSPASAQAAAVLQLVLRCRSTAVTFAALAPGKLRFFLKGQSQHAFDLYEMLFGNVLELTLANGSSDTSPTALAPACIHAVGFGAAEGLLPYPARSFLGYRLLTEFFAFPEKFLFFDLAMLGARELERVGNELTVSFYLNRLSPVLEQNVSADTFRLGCTPIVNLYTQRAEPILLTHTDWEYQVVPDARRPLAHEIYSIDRVDALSPEGEAVEYRPFFSAKHADEKHDPARFFHATRRASGPLQGGTEVYVSLVDLGFQVDAPADWSLDLRTTCLNRDLPRRLPFGGGQPRLQFMEGGALVSDVTCLTAPTATLRPALKKGALWRLISHLSLNHLSLLDAEDGAGALREILKLYDFTDSEETRSMIAGVQRVSGRRTVRRPDPRGGSVCRGTEVTIQLNEKRFSGSGLFLFAGVLDRFLPLYCSINSFSRLVVTLEGRKGEPRKWPPRMGERVLL